MTRLNSAERRFLYALIKGKRNLLTFNNQETTRKLKSNHLITLNENGVAITPKARFLMEVGFI